MQIKTLLRILVTVVAVAVVVLLRSRSRSEPPEQPASSALPASAELWTLQDVGVEPAEGLRVLVLHDMEGLSGEDDWRYFDYGQELYPAGQELLAADVNAVIDGLFAGGATEVDVVDGHGSGNPDPDVRS